MNAPSISDQTIIDRLNSELSTIPVPPRVGRRPARRAQRSLARLPLPGLLTAAFRDSRRRSWAPESAGYGGVAIAIPTRIPRRRLLPWLLLALVIVAAALYGPPLVRVLNGGAPTTDLATPTLHLSLSAASYESGETISGEATIASSSAITLQDLSVSIFPVGARQTGIEESSVRTRLIVIPVNPGTKVGPTASYRFTWDQRQSDGTLAPRGDYVVTARVGSRTDQGNSHAATTVLANEVAMSLR
jgi:hypothetical protein